MIFVDASAIVAFILAEPEATALAAALDRGEPAFTSPIAIYEASLAVSRASGQPVPLAQTDVRQTLQRMEIAIVEIDDEQASLALAAFERFGKGRHPAALTMGDCFAYASTSSRDAHILFKGGDFGQTDLPSALPSS
ncbi:type II toxin-antitoxin system VapC family toxin [Bosea sp. (in: a-proteobacteria)]|jgi:ribonuclease VapC|uniref:type II toxin-antitoxin system VapC family toxin n=1 Tax=Bosea sp. (in: a-proteobacteria) TaxID=1871050 RepID=UPI003567DE6F